jgi:hypothetical protein
MAPHHSRAFYDLERASPKDISFDNISSPYFHPLQKLINFRVDKFHCLAGKTACIFPCDATITVPISYILDKIRKCTILRGGRIRLDMVNCTKFEFHILKIEFLLGIDLKAFLPLESYHPFDFGLHIKLSDKVSYHIQRL